MPYATLGRIFLKVALWCLHNPAKVDAGLADIHSLVNELHPFKPAKPTKP
jgi:hypothetical protein